MLFKKFHIPLIQTGRKTETRRLTKPRLIAGHLYKSKTTFRRKERLGYIKVLKIWEEKLGAISHRSVRREGYDSREEYFATLRQIHIGKKLDLRKKVWVIKFRWQVRSHQLRWWLLSCRHYLRQKESFGCSS